MIKMAERYCATTRNKILYPLTTENMLKNLRRISLLRRDKIIIFNIYFNELIQFAIILDTSLPDTGVK